MNLFSVVINKLINGNCFIYNWDEFFSYFNNIFLHFFVEFYISYILRFFLKGVHRSLNIKLVQQ